MGNVHLLFDGDILAYRAGFAAERRVYFDGRLPERGASFDSKKEALKNLPEEHIEWERELQPVEHALENCKSLIRNISNEMSLHFDARVSYICFLTGNSEVPNFRKEIDPEYKANRKEEHKPTHLQAIQEYILQYHQGYFTQGCEADDFFGHAAQDAKDSDQIPIIVSVDKDLKQIPGYHYNIGTRTLSFVDEAEASAVFWRQMLEGDKVDNITGINGIGKIKAARYIPIGQSNGECQRVVEEFYKKEFLDGWKEKFNANCELLWIWKKIPDECPFKVEEEENKESAATSPL